VNLYGQKPEVAKRLKADLSEWRKSIRADLPTEPNLKFDEGIEREAIRGRLED